jgi:hypothetical protein
MTVAKSFIAKALGVAAIRPMHFLSLEAKLPDFKFKNQKFMQL